VSDRVHLVWEVIPFENIFLSAPIHSPPLWSPNRSFKYDGDDKIRGPWLALYSLGGRVTSQYDMGVLVAYG
jgi:hypothetical protein